jgi:hypothetical protein
MVLARPQARSTIKIGSKNSLYTYSREIRRAKIKKHWCCAPTIQLQTKRAGCWCALTRNPQKACVQGASRAQNRLNLHPHEHTALMSAKNEDAAPAQTNEVRRAQQTRTWRKCAKTKNHRQQQDRTSDESVEQKRSRPRKSAEKRSLRRRRQTEISQREDRVLERAPNTGEENLA